MRHFLPLPVVLVLAACGMKGDLYEAPPPAEPPAPVAQPGPDTTEPGDRKTIPSTPDPARSE